MGKEELKIVGRAYSRWVALGVVLGIMVRILLALHPLTDSTSLTAGHWAGLFAIGAVNDICVMTLMFVPFALFWISSGHWRLTRPQSFIFLALIAIGWAWVTFGAQQLHEFNRGLARALSWVMVWWFVSFALRAFIPSIRKGWMRFWSILIMFVYLAVFVLNIFGEWLFWDEFGVRYNFIAVDYLVYTNEVVGNIMQSYSMGWILTGVAVIAALLEWTFFRKELWHSAVLWNKGWRLKAGAAVVAGVVASLFILQLTEKGRHSSNTWYNQLQANGAYSFVEAFMKNHLDYEEFYVTCPPEVIETELAEALALPAGKPSEQLRPNIVLITMESMSADYMERFGNKDHLTPTLDSLWTRSLAFDNMFAAGNRTVRGLEALTLSRPPAPGESIIKRPDNGGYPSIADALREKGYDLNFYYGGNSYFDNMEQFFSGLGYRIRDRKTMNPDSITSQTVWGVCDGDVYDRVIADLDREAASGNPIFAHIMTTSNHRPYIYPDGCVSIPPSKKSRKGAVMYSDYAVGRFLEKAAAKPWRDNTIFVIVADHCASSAGSTELPLVNYHIPALIYAPTLFRPQTVTTVSSQIDLMPTLFSALGWPVDGNLYGRDILSTDYQPRAFIATYQDLGYLSNDTLTVLSPGRNVRQFTVAPTAADPYALRPIDTPSESHIRRAAALYQSASD